ncbi:hypothetical protein [Burkholderia multivorans]|uniref:hypothetical protein n=1 Tax=Burkholderia multivorans TaxID=87883 RepID=UPI0020B21060|nr:hypothetical protein [Burkholderia multivorans]MDN8078644.1 hypothetical protein [Burkholderia multivorans]
MKTFVDRCVQRVLDADLARRHAYLAAAPDLAELERRQQELARNDARSTGFRDFTFGA